MSGNNLVMSFQNVYCQLEVIGVIKLRIRDSRGTQHAQKRSELHKCLKHMSQTRTALFWVITLRVVGLIDHEDGTDRLCRNTGQKLPLLAG